MNEEFRKSFFTSKTLLKNKIETRKSNNSIRFSMNSQRKLPTILINQPNNKLDFTTKQNKFHPKSLYKLKTLNVSKTQHTPFEKRLPSSNFNLRKNSFQIFNLKNKMNNLNNLDTLNNSFMEKNSKKRLSRNYTNEVILSNPKLSSNNYNSDYNINQINPIYTKPFKNPNDFDVSEEDRIFNQYKKKKNEKSKTKKVKAKVKIKLKKKKLKNFYSYDAALGKVYKKIPKIINKIEDTKKLKGGMSLLKYQNLLMDVGTKNLNREDKQKLNNKFRTLRIFSDKSYNLLRDTLESIEKDEKKIIDSINTQQNYYKRKMRENNFFTISSSKHFGFINLPNLKFHKIGQSKKKPKFKFK